MTARKTTEAPASIKKALQLRVSELETEVNRLEKELDHAQTNQNHPSRHIWRKLSIVLLTVITAILLNLSIFAVWLRRNIVNTDVWVNNTTQIIQSAPVREQIANKTAAAIIEKSDAKTYIQQILPEQIKPLSEPLTNSLQTYTSQQINSTLQSEQFIQVWQNASRSAHQGIIQSLQAASNGNTAAIPTDTLLYIKDDQLMLNMQPVVVAIKDRLVNRGLSFANRFDGSNAPRIEVAKIENMNQILASFNLLNKAAVALPLLALVSLIATLALALDKRRTLIAVMLTVVAATVLNVQLIYLARYPLIQAATNATANAATSSSTAAIFDIMSQSVVLMSRVVMASALVIALIAYMAGPGKIAVGIRHGIARFVHSLNLQSGWVQWLGRNGLRVLAAVVTLGIILIVFPPIAGAGFAITVFVITVLLSAMLYWLHQAVTTAK